jgi:UDP-N-acetylmuramate dehydrogenase
MRRCYRHTYVTSMAAERVGHACMVITTEQVRLADYTTLHLGGPAERFVAAGTEDDLVAAVRAADAEAEPVLVLGGGSNLVVADEGFPGVVVLAAAAGVEFAADGDAVLVTAAAGQDWDEFVQQCLAEELSGVECLSGIPGRAGATPIQNVNAYGQDVAHTITSVRAYDRLTDRIVQIAGADCGFGYRTSMFKRQAAGDAGGRPAGRAASGGTSRGEAMNPAAATGRFVILAVTFRLAVSPYSAPVRYGELSRVLGVAEGERVPAQEARAAVLQLRRSKGMVLDARDPDTRSAGSFFTNPVVGASQYEALAGRVAAADPADGSAGVPHWPAEDGQVKLSAAWLIEHAGFGKGYRRASDPAGARISTKHALALTNPGEGSTASLIRLARQIRAGVLEAFGVELTNEPVLVGVAL